MNKPPLKVSDRLESDVITPQKMESAVKAFDLWENKHGFGDAHYPFSETAVEELVRSIILALQEGG